MYLSESNAYTDALYEKLGIGARSIASTGQDLSIEALKDLLTDNGDFRLISGADLIKTALIRRLGTPEYGYRRWVRTKDGLKELDPSYGDRVYLYLSAPLSHSNAEQVRLAILNCMQAEERIEVLSVVVNATSEVGQIVISATYRIKGEEDLQSLDYVLSN